jgi:DNA-binding winged helix-turn-helix (wHTH) protein
MEVGLRHGFRLLDVNVDPEHHRIEDHRRAKSISPGAMDFLMALVESPDDVIPIESLLVRLQVVSVEELDRRFAELRDALGDSATEPQYVRKVAGTGFQLVASVCLDAPPDPTTDQILNS